jgi:hypothetical protein
MGIKNRLLVWLLRSNPSMYVRLKKLKGLEISQDRQFLDIHAEMLEDGRGIQTLAERYNLYSLVKATSKLPGALAEVGVYRGGSAKLLCKVKGNTPIYLFDTFEGMPQVNKNSDGAFSTGDFADTGYEDVRAFLSGFSGVHIFKGFFPDSAIGQEPERQQYRFVHLDLDIYESTFKALSFFYPRMTAGGVILSHDYNQLAAPGVKKAFHDFFHDKREIIIPIWDTQCAVIKLPANE